jgi:transcriptional regulator with XRE-family HTH domain
MSLRRIFIENMKRFRKLEGISQMTLAARCDSSHNYIAEIEAGRRFPSVEKIESLAAALRVEPCLFFMKDEGADLEKPDLNPTREYLRKMPRGIKKELSAYLLHTLQAGIRLGVDDSFNPENY